MNKLLRIARSATAAGSSEPAVRPRLLACSEEGEAQLLPPPRHGPTARAFRKDDASAADQAAITKIEGLTCIFGLYCQQAYALLTGVLANIIRLALI